MRYKELKIRTSRTDLELIETILIENGFTGMMIDDPADVRDILEHPDTYRYDYIDNSLTEDLGRDPVITLYFTDDEEGMAEMGRASELVLSAQKADGVRSMLPEDNVRTALVCEDAGDDSEWLYKWQEHFKPTRVGRSIVVKPSWEEYSAESGDLVIEMDPGMAFGSGLHETTSMCIKALEQILGQKDPEGADRTGEGVKDRTKGIKILDVGCGTGILAIAGALLGAEECLGIDIDPDAVRVAEENIAKNGLSDRITARYGDLTEGVDYEADILVANLMADLVIRLSPAAYNHVREGGWYVTSGILDIKEDIVAQAIREAGFEICEILSDGEWRAVIARKQSA